MVPALLLMRRARPFKHSLGAITHGPADPRHSSGSNLKRALLPFMEVPEHEAPRQSIIGRDDPDVSLCR